MHAFSYARASTVEEAAVASGRGARLLAGGTDLLTVLKRRLEAPRELVDVKRMAEAGLRAVERTADGGLRIGALVTLAEVEAHPLVTTEALRALAEACGSAATPALRNQATIGGNLLQAPRCWYYRGGVRCVAAGGVGCPARDGDARFHALFPGAECIDVHPSDPVTALALLRARVEVRDAGTAVREVPVAGLLHAPTRENPRLHALAPGEVVTAVLVPAAPAGYRSVYEKGSSREAWTFALAGVAAGGVPAGPDEKPQGLRFAIGGVAAAPIVTPDVELALAGATPHPTNGYKMDLVRGLAARALERLTGSSPAA